MNFNKVSIYNDELNIAVKTQNERKKPNKFIDNLLKKNILVRSISFPEINGEFDNFFELLSKKSHLSNQDLVYFDENRLVSFVLKIIDLENNIDSREHIFNKVIASPTLLHAFKNSFKTENTLIETNNSLIKLQTRVKIASKQYKYYKKKLKIEKGILKKTTFKNLQDLEKFLTNKDNLTLKNCYNVINTVKNIELFLHAIEGYKKLKIEKNFYSYIAKLVEQEADFQKEVLESIIKISANEKEYFTLSEKKDIYYTGQLISSATAEKSVATAVNINKLTIDKVLIYFKKPYYLSFYAKDDLGFAEKFELEFPAEVLYVEWLHENKVPNIMPKFDKIQNERIDIALQKKMFGDGRVLYKNNAAFSKILTNFIQITEAMAAMHALDVTHGDIKPDNFLIDREGGDAILSDFGGMQFIERGLSENSFENFVQKVIQVNYDISAEIKLKNINTKNFTHGYASPELTPDGFAKIITEKVNSINANTKESDVYALGATIYEIMVNRILQLPKAFTMKDKKVKSENEITENIQGIKEKIQYKKLLDSEQKIAEKLFDLSVDLMQTNSKNRRTCNNALNYLKN